MNQYLQFNILSNITHITVLCISQKSQVDFSLRKNMKWKTLFLVFVASVDGLDRKTTFAQESSVKEVDSKSLSCQRYKLNIYRRNILLYNGFKPKLNTTGNWFIEHFKVNICKEEIYWTFLCHYKGVFFFFLL